MTEPTEPRELDLTAEQPAEEELFTLLQRSYPPRPTPAEETERGREQTRGRIAYLLIGTLVAIVVATFLYIIWLSADFAQLGTNDLINVMQSVGTTLLSPLVGLIGAVIGFYFGGQTAVQAASQATQAASLGARTAREASQVGAQVAKEASQVGAQTATEAAIQAGQQGTSGESVQR
jgi:uncharacterized membrane protein